MDKADTFQPKADRGAVLLVGSTTGLRAQISQWISRQHYAVVCAEQAQDAQEIMTRLLPALVIVLDPAKPDGRAHSSTVRADFPPQGTQLTLARESKPAQQNSVQILRCLRRLTDVPVVVITSHNSEASRVQNYHNGADDVICASLSQTEMELKLGALLRRLPIAESTHTPSELILERLHLDRNTCKASCNNTEMEFTPLQFRLLWLLARHRNRLLSRETLYRHGLEKPLTPYDRSLDMQLSRIRKKLITLGLPADSICCIRGHGYKFCYDTDNA